MINECAFVPSSNSIGGTWSFQSRLADAFEKCGIRCTDALSDKTGAVLVFTHAPFRLLLRAKRQRIPIILRLDGRYFRAKHGIFHREYLNTNLRVVVAALFLADLIIYQSEFSRLAWRSLLFWKKSFEIILNGINLCTTVPARNTDRGSFRFVAVGSFRGEDMLPLTAKAMGLVPASYPVTLDIFGTIAEHQTGLLQQPGINYRGRIPPESIQQTIAQYDALIFTQISPACPNVVIEAVSVGVPVIAFDTGAVREILRFNENLIAPTPAKLFHSIRDLDPAALARCIVKYLQNPSQYSDVAMENRNRCATFDSFAQYRSIFEHLAASAQARRAPTRLH